ncbi:MAG: hypothetical protein RLW62_15130 [Gammaproteobacteria bacterium]
MDIDPELYARVSALAAALTAAVEREDEPAYRSKYGELEALCADAMASNAAHPFFLESLGDFTLSDEEALEIYEEALDSAAASGLRDYAASIYLAIAERYLELEDKEGVLAYANQARVLARELNDESLAREADELIRMAGKVL